MKDNCPPIGGHNWNARSSETYQSIEMAPGGQLVAELGSA